MTYASYRRKFKNSTLVNVTCVSVTQTRLQYSLRRSSQQMWNGGNILRQKLTFLKRFWVRWIENPRVSFIWKSNILFWAILQHVTKLVSKIHLDVHLNQCEMMETFYDRNWHSWKDFEWDEQKIQECPSYENQTFFFELFYNTLQN